MRCGVRGTVCGTRGSATALPDEGVRCCSAFRPLYIPGPRCLHQLPERRSRIQAANCLCRNRPRVNSRVSISLRMVHAFPLSDRMFHGMSTLGFYLCTERFKDRPCVTVGVDVDFPAIAGWRGEASSAGFPFRNVSLPYLGCRCSPFSPSGAVVPSLSLSLPSALLQSTCPYHPPPWFSPLSLLLVVVVVVLFFLSLLCFCVFPLCWCCTKPRYLLSSQRILSPLLARSSSFPRSVFSIAFFPVAELERPPPSPQPHPHPRTFPAYFRFPSVRPRVVVSGGTHPLPYGWYLSTAQPLSVCHPFCSLCPSVKAAL
eukprot:RCo010785